MQRVCSSMLNKSQLNNAVGSWIAAKMCGFCTWCFWLNGLVLMTSVICFNMRSGNFGRRGEIETGKMSKEEGISLTYIMIKICP